LNTDIHSTLRILHLEDSDFDAELIQRELRKGGLDCLIHRVQTESEFRKELETFDPDLLLLDYRLPSFDGAKALVIAKKCDPSIPSIIVSGTVGEDTAIELLRNGATDFVIKDRISGRLVPAIQRAIEEYWNRRARLQAEEELKELNKELLRAATHDSLTGLAARPLILEKLLEKSHSIDPLSPDSALFSIDINRFKEVNDRYGTSFGDQLLIETARRLSQIALSGDVVANLGGDRFLFLAGSLKEHGGMEALASKIRHWMMETFVLRNLRIQIQVSICGLLLASPEMKPQEVMSLLDEGMHQAKLKHHRTPFIIDKSFSESLRNRAALDLRVMDAVKDNRMFLAFQPIVDLFTGKISGAEALLRCKNPDGSVQSAGEFIPSLIRLNYLGVMDEWAFSHFLEFAPYIAGPLVGIPDFRVSFNASLSLLGSVGFAEKLLNQVQEAQFPPKSLKLEILEGEILSSDGVETANLNTLRAAGVKIALDDFGSAYSNLMRLASLPIDQIKIDRSLLAGIRTGDTKVNSVLKTALDIAHNLGYETLAEGVETEEEAAFLRELGCQYGQGFLYGKAMMMEDLIRKITSQS
jgi:diguanylate cyclase (GGDEF)-like protein